jgi:hypothetical protein
MILVEIFVETVFWIILSNFRAAKLLKIEYPSKKLKEKYLKKLRRQVLFLFWKLDGGSNISSCYLMSPQCFFQLVGGEFDTKIA